MNAQPIQHTPGSNGTNGAPEARFKAGAITATVWKNEQQADNNKFAYFSVSMDRSYKDKQGNWKKIYWILAGFSLMALVAIWT